MQGSKNIIAFLAPVNLQYNRHRGLETTIFFFYCLAMQGPTFSIEHSDYPAVESDGEVTVCVAYYGPRPLSADATIQLSTDDNPISPGQSQGIPTHAVTL